MIYTDYELTELITAHLKQSTGFVDEKRAAKIATGLARTDMDAATVIEKAFPNVFHFVASGKSSGDWYVWNSVIHEREEDDRVDGKLVDAFITGMGKYIHETFKNIDGGEPVDKQLSQVWKYLDSLKGYRNAQNLRNRLRYQMTVPASWIDQGAAYIVWADGKVTETARLDGPLLDPCPTRPVTSHMEVTLGEGDAPRFRKSLDDRKLSPDVQHYLKLAAGAALLGRGDAKNIPTLVGTTNTGKSSYIATLAAAFGGYARNIPPGAIVERNGANFEQHLARGGRFLYIEEPYDKKIDDAFLKAFADGRSDTTVSTQQKGRDVVQWKPQGVLHIAANHVPRINAQDHAIRDRMNIVGFNHRFTSSDSFQNLEAFLIRHEGPQIGRWLLDGAKAYAALSTTQISIPDSMRQAALSNATEASTSLRWFTEQVESKRFVTDGPILPTNMVKATKELYQDFQNWCFDEGIKEVPIKLTWQREISRYMGATPADLKQRPKGYARLWNVGESSGLPVTVTESGHAVIR